GELEHFHARETGFAQQCAHLSGNQAKVFGDHWCLPLVQRRRNSVEHSPARTLDPGAVDRRFGASRHFPGSLEAAEMIDAHQIDLLEQPAESRDPPRMPGVGHRLPVVEGVAPQLTGRAEVVGWYASHDPRLTVFVEFEETLVRPDVGAIVSDE